MKLKLLLPLLLSGAMPVYGQVNLSGMMPESTDSSGTGLSPDMRDMRGRPKLRNSKSKAEYE